MVDGAAARPHPFPHSRAAAPPSTSIDAWIGLVPVTYIPGLVMRRAAQLYPGEAKTDPRDARVLADTARTRREQIHWLQPTDEQLEQLRVLNRCDADLAAEVNRTANRLRDALTSVCSALERALGERLGHTAVRTLLAKFPTPSALAAAGIASIRRVLKTHAPRLANSLSALGVDALRAQTLRVPPEAPRGRIIRELAADLDRLHTRREKLLQEIEELFLAHPLGPILVSLPGIGPRTGARILAEIADGSRFASGAKLASYAGLTPVVHRSGSSVKGERRSRRGNHRLKNALFLAVLASLRFPDSRAYDDRKRAEGKRHNAAVICPARRRCDAILAMLRSRPPYRLQVVLPSAA